MRLSSLALLVCFVASPVVAADAPQLEERSKQPSYLLSNADVEVAITKTGGHMTAVFARKSDKPIAPYHVSPWQTEGLQIDPAILRVLRGDFFCLPFGGNGDAFNNERHPPHGETANSEWKFAETIDEDTVQGLKLTLKTKVRAGSIDKILWVVNGQPVVYSSHVVQGFVGPAPVAHHATLALPNTPRVVNVSTSPISFGITNPTRFSDPAKQENQALAINARFTDLKKVPVLDPDTSGDCSSFPTRKGAADFFGVVNKQPDANDDTPAWVAAVNTEAGTLWFALKDSRVLPMTYFWIENGGRHGAPWNGRNNCLGLEDACSYFADGLAPSIADNLLTKEGVKTAIIKFTGDKPTVINYIQGAVKVPAGFDRVASVAFTAQTATFKSESGQEVVVPVSKEFLRIGKKAFP